MPTPAGRITEYIRQYKQGNRIAIFLSDLETVMRAIDMMRQQHAHHGGLGDPDRCSGCEALAKLDKDK